MAFITPEFWPPISNVMHWYNADHVQIVQGGTYQKQSNLNRCKIAGVNGVLTLSIPLIGGREQKALLKEVQIDNTQKMAIAAFANVTELLWQITFFRLLFPCYRKFTITKSSVLI